IVLDPTIQSIYFPRETPKALARQYFNYGIGKASTLAKHRRLPTWRPLVPAALVAGTAVALVAAKGPARVALPLTHLVTAGAIGLRLGRHNSVAPHRAAGAIVICHWSYGAGFLRGLGRWLTGRGFETSRR
ncbi:MAG: glycosyltransferase family 2 protein, partial [Acidimicrobiales bacterium]